MLEEEEFGECYELLVSKADMVAQIGENSQNNAEANSYFVGRMMSGAITKLKFW